MKNIHIIPTDKPSRLFLNKVNNKLLLEDISNPNLKNVLPSGIYQNIYITNYEEIKDKDYVLSDASIGALYLDGVMNTDSMLAEGQWKKIILTTDVDLIKDGVQEIDDTFLEWFIKNPSCEFVDIKKGYKNPNSKSFLSEVYKIYVPTEKFKQEALNHFLSTSSVIVKDPQTSNFNKQETFEEVAENFWLNDDSMTDDDRISYVNGFVTCAKWQQSYSEEEVLKLILTSSKLPFANDEERIDWFEKFKKKEE